MAHAMRLKPRPKYGDREGRLFTRLAYQEDSWGWSFGPEAETMRNYTPLSTFRLYFEAFVPSHPGSTSHMPGGGVETLVKLSNKQYRVVLDVDSLMSKTAVLVQLTRQCPNGMFLATGLPDTGKDADWHTVVEGAMAPLLREFSRNGTEKEPVKYIGLQAQLLPQKLSNLEPSHIRYFFNNKDGVLDSRGVPVVNSMVVYDHSQMKGAKQIEYKPSGLKGFLAFLEAPLAYGHGSSYFEQVLTSGFPMLLGWASPFNMWYLKKLPTVILEGPPGKNNNNIFCASPEYASLGIAPNLHIEKNIHIEIFQVWAKH